MTKRLAILAIVLGGLAFAAPHAVFARSIGDLHVHLVANSQELDQACSKYTGASGPDVYACFLNSPRNDIYIRTDLKSFDFRFVFLHELGHFFLQDSEAQLPAVFSHITNYPGTGYSPHEAAANEFAWWVILPSLVTPAEQKIFIEALKN